jgi:hypothetical protein
VIEEYVRLNGHADFLGERIDGRVWTVAAKETPLCRKPHCR